MPGNESRTQGFPKRFSWHRQCFGKKQTDLQGEKGVLELISMGAPLLDVLNKLCTAIDLQIGNVVSVILLADGQEHDLQANTRRALQCGLHVFWCAGIALQDEKLLGTFEMYCCVSRSPTPFELQLIQRVTHLAALAIRHHKGKEDFKSVYIDWKSALRRSSHEGHRLN